MPISDAPRPDGHVICLGEPLGDEPPSPSAVEESGPAFSYGDSLALEWERAPTELTWGPTDPVWLGPSEIRVTKVVPDFSAATITYAEYSMVVGERDGAWRVLSDESQPPR